MPPSWYCRDLLRTLPDRLTAWLGDVAAQMEPEPPECTCRSGGEPVPILAWELGDTLETGATGSVIDHRCPTCWLPRTERPVHPRHAWKQPGSGAGVRFGGERRALIFTDTNAGEHQVYCARLLDGTTRNFPTMDEARTWILTTRLPDPGKSLRH